MAGDQRSQEDEQRGGVLGRASRSSVRGFGALTARWRPDPDFLIIGAKRGGTTSFYYHLAQHPQVAALVPRPLPFLKPLPTKGAHFFDTNYDRGERWYRSYLPTTLTRANDARRAGGPVVVGEASPYYLFHPRAAERCAAMLPNTKIIAVLRDPVWRTFSHWKERRRANDEPLEFAEALAAEAERVGDAEQRMATDPSYYSYAHENYSYATQSEYDRSLARWLTHYRREQILVLRSEDYYRDPNETLNTTAAFLDIEPVDIPNEEARNATTNSALDASIRDILAARFAPHVRRLEDQLDRSFDWL